jgi:hypothetical protein|tara:strand:- start:54 stop:278 length:225 start_codon:yes stop_codon:yes gene_type:complete
MTNTELNKEIIDILDNVMYWETCPKNYKVRIEAIKKQLTLTDVVKPFYCYEELANGKEKCSNECADCVGIEPMQ